MIVSHGYSNRNTYSRYWLLPLMMVVDGCCVFDADQNLIRIKTDIMAIGWLIKNCSFIVSNICRTTVIYDHDYLQMTTIMFEDSHHRINVESRWCGYWGSVIWYHLKRSPLVLCYQSSETTRSGNEVPTSISMKWFDLCAPFGGQSYFIGHLMCSFH